MRPVKCMRMQNAVSRRVSPLVNHLISIFALAFIIKLLVQVLRAGGAGHDRKVNIHCARPATSLLLSYTLTATRVALANNFSIALPYLGGC